MSEDLDNAAAAALYALVAEGDPTLERLGLLYEIAGRISRTQTQTSGRKDESRGRFEIPAGSLRALFHNHPLTQNPWRNQNIGRFSPDDMAQANRLRVPSYISVGDEVRRYDPGSPKERGEAVLAEFPIAEHRRLLMARILQRAPDDPRGPYR